MISIEFNCLALVHISQRPVRLQVLTWARHKSCQNIRETNLFNSTHDMQARMKFAKDHQDDL